MNKILIAIDSFKGSLSSVEAANAIEEGLLEAGPELKITKVPIADGGEGTVEAMVECLGGDYVNVEVNDPLFRKTKATYGLIDSGNTAVVEMASASGITLLQKEERNPLLTTTYGTGELIKDTLQRGVNKILVGIGGSATNDGGTGMASALGYRFLDNYGNPVEPIGGKLNDIARIDSSGVHPGIKDLEVIVICDVKNPLLGEQGASAVYGPQKGATTDMVRLLDNNLKHFSAVIEKEFGRSQHTLQGTGAAGGLGYGLVTFLNANLVSGIDFLIDVLNIDAKIKESDIVITGEGKMDTQTSNNKAPWGIMQLAKRHSKKVCGIAGYVEPDAEDDLSNHFDYIYSLVDEQTSIAESMSNPAFYLAKKASEFSSKVIGRR